MKNIKENFCHTCGLGKFEMLAIEGRMICKYLIPSFVRIPTCNNCGEEKYNEELINILSPIRPLKPWTSTNYMTNKKFSELHLNKKVKFNKLGLSIFDGTSDWIGVVIGQNDINFIMVDTIFPKNFIGFGKFFDCSELELVEEVPKEILQLIRSKMTNHDK